MQSKLRLHVASVVCTCMCMLASLSSKICSCRNHFEHVICTFSFRMLTTDHILYVPDVIPSFVNYLPYLRQMLRLVYIMARFKLKITFFKRLLQQQSRVANSTKTKLLFKKKENAKKNANGECGRVYICAQKGASLGQSILRYIFFLVPFIFMTRSVSLTLCSVH